MAIIRGRSKRVQRRWWRAAVSYLCVPILPLSGETQIIRLSNFSPGYSEEVASEAKPKVKKQGGCGGTSRTSPQTLLASVRMLNSAISRTSQVARTSLKRRCLYYCILRTLSRAETNEKFLGLHSSRARLAISNFQMPAMSPTMTEGGIASWKKQEGETFAAGDVLLEIVRKPSLAIPMVCGGLLCVP
jgi:hypothetical protein